MNSISGISVDEEDNKREQQREDAEGRYEHERSREEIITNTYFNELRRTRIRARTEERMWKKIF